ncbi:TonB-dependent receptor [Microbulbifer hainanensis]|uniref:TonB-dependent receptor n=1 Tax=Microbulbifer hainanensis TaxID=2735675 RepID=UPI001865F309|nr:TonB-dependent receptor [Microbulbifer hainanensis]
MNNNKFRGLLPAVSVLSAGVAVANLAFAQESKSAYAIEEVTVTARKVEENLQEVPIAVTAFSGDMLERRQINSSDDIGKITPNLQFSNNAPLAGNNNSSVIFIRGVGQISARANTDPGVGLYIDDVYMGQSVGGSMEMRDIANVQVLRGPQGTLFGRNTIGGAVLLSTTEPGDELGGKARVGMGEDGLFEVFGAVDLPVSDTLKTRFTIGSKQQDGYVIRVSDGTDLGDTNNMTLTGKLVFEPSDSFRAKLNLDYTEADENGSPLVFAGYNNNTDVNDTSADAAWFGANQSVGAGCPDAWIAQPGPPGRPVETADGSALDVSGLLTAGGGPRGYVGENADPRCVNSQWDAGPYASNGTYPVESTLDNRGISTNLEWSLNDSTTLKSITSYRELAWTGKRDADNTPFTILHTDFDSSGDQFSQEFQLNYESESLTAVAGLYYYDETVTDILKVQVADRPSGFSCGEGTDRCHLDSDNNITDNQSVAMFGQLTYDVTETLSATLGIRRTEETKASIPDQFDYIDPEVKYLPKKRYEADFSATTVSGSLSYNVSDTTMVYGSYSEGFKGGGWNSTFNFALTESDLEAGHQFDQEEVKTYELGFKSDLSDSLRVNGAVFSSDYTDLQFTYRVFIAPWIFNAGKASIDGAELEFTWLPSDNWIVEGGLGYLDSSIDETAEIVVPGRPVNSGVAQGNQLPFSPELQGNVGVGYNLDLGTYLVSPRVDISYSDPVFFDASNTALIAQMDSYAVVDLSVAVEAPDADWKLVVGANNATDEEYRVSGNSSLSSGSGYAEAAYARPRVLFANLTYNF